MSSVRSNLWKLYFFEFFQNALFAVPTLVLFYEENGITIAQFFVLQSIFTFVWVVADIPSGYFADRYGRRNAMILGCLFACASCALNIVGHTFLQFIAIQVLQGISLSFHSGTIDALTYDTLLEIGEEKRFRRITSNQLSLAWLSTGVVGIVGGIIANFSLRMTFVATLPFYIAALVISFTLIEPKRHAGEHTLPVRTAMNAISNTLIRQPAQRAIILLFSIPAAMTFALVWLTQPYQTEIGLPVAFFGIAGAVFMLGLIGFSKSAHFFEESLDDRFLLIGLAVLVLLCFFGLSLKASWLGLFLLLIGRSTYGILSPLTSDMLNKITPSDTRATVLSTKSTVYNLLFSVISPFVGYVAGAFPLSETMLLMGIGGSIFVFGAVLFAWQAWAELPQ